MDRTEKAPSVRLRRRTSAGAARNAPLWTAPAKGNSWTGPKRAPSVRLRWRTTTGEARDSPTLDGSSGGHQLDRTEKGPLRSAPEEDIGLTGPRPPLWIIPEVCPQLDRSGHPPDGSVGKTQAEPVHGEPPLDSFGGVARSDQPTPPSGRTRRGTPAGPDSDAPLDGTGGWHQLDMTEKNPLLQTLAEDLGRT